MDDNRKQENIRWEKDKVYNLAIPEEFELYLERLEYYVRIRK